MKPGTLFIGGLVLGGLIFASEAAAYTVFKKAEKPYGQTIDTVAKRYGVSRHVVAAILWKESRFNPAAVGKAGEHGMGQTMPAAWQDLQTTFDRFRNVPYDDMFTDPDLQIEATAAFYALKRRDMGNPYDALRAYNAGTGNAKASAGVSVNYALDVLKIALVGMVFAGLDGNA